MNGTVEIGTLAIAAASLIYTFGPIRRELDACRRELDACRRERAELRRRLNAITAALVGLLPADVRGRLLAEITDPIRDTLEDEAA